MNGTRLTAPKVASSVNQENFEEEISNLPQQPANVFCFITDLFRWSYSLVQRILYAHLIPVRATETVNKLVT